MWSSGDVYSVRCRTQWLQVLKLHVKIQCEGGWAATAHDHRKLGPDLHRGRPPRGSLRTMHHEDASVRLDLWLASRLRSEVTVLI